LGCGTTWKRIPAYYVDAQKEAIDSEIEWDEVLRKDEKPKQGDQ
jgi:hypothetical protein